MKFLKVKQIGNDLPIFLNPSQVVSININTGHTIIKMTSGEKVNTEEKPRDILGQLEERL